MPAKPHLFSASCFISTNNNSTLRGEKLEKRKQRSPASSHRKHSQLSDLCVTANSAEKRLNSWPSYPQAPAPVIHAHEWSRSGFMLRALRWCTSTLYTVQSVPDGGVIRDRAALCRLESHHFTHDEDLNEADADWALLAWTSMLVQILV